MTDIKFGTDGWRAVMADTFTFANVGRMAQAAADYWTAHPAPATAKRVVVGYDRRFLSESFGRRVAEVFCGNGFETVLTSAPTATPAISFTVHARQAVGGVVITASHNPPTFNGFKLKSHFGGPSDAATSEAIESFLDRNPVRLQPLEDAVRGRRARVLDLLPAYFQAVKRLVDFKLIAQSKLRFAHDALFGVGAGCFERLLADTTCRVTALNAAHDVMFGGLNPEPVPANYRSCSAYLRQHPHDFCLVTDGDADRIGAMDGHGKPISTHQVICLLLRHLVLNRGGRGRVVKALNTTSMLDKMCLDYGLELLETDVGFKSICTEMLKGGVLFGAEESGSVGFAGHIPERDGILAGMMILELLAAERRSINTLLAGLEKKYGPHHYARVDIHFPIEKRAALMDYCQHHPPARLLRSPVIDMRTFDGVKYVARDSSWLMVRGSGTEPVVRIYAEGHSARDAQTLVRFGLRLTKCL
jgi:phosphomannomutase